MHGLQACLFKSITVAALRIYLRVVKMPLKGEVGGHALKSHGNYIVDHRKSWKNHGIVFLNFCGNPDLSIDAVKPVFRGFRQNKIQTSLLSFRSGLEN